MKFFSLVPLQSDFDIELENSTAEPLIHSQQLEFFGMRFLGISMPCQSPLPLYTSIPIYSVLGYLFANSGHCTRNLSAIQINILPDTLNAVTLAKLST